MSSQEEVRRDGGSGSSSGGSGGGSGRETGAYEYARGPNGAIVKITPGNSPAGRRCAKCGCRCPCYCSCCKPFCCSDNH